MIKKKQEKTIRALSHLMDELDLTEISIQEGKESIHLAKKAHSASAMPHQDALFAPKQEHSPKDLEDATSLVTSPMVGVAYLCPAPKKPPFIKAGDKVIKGQNLLIIEAMKSMNYITAHEAGVVEKIVVENEQPVEYGTPLVYIKPHA